MAWEPSDQEIEDKLIELAYVWGDIEEQLEFWAADRPFESDDYTALEMASMAALIQMAFRVEATFEENGWGDPCVWYVLYYDVTNAEAREAANRIEESHELRRLVRELAKPWHSDDFLNVRRVPRGAPVEGQLCRRLGEEHPPKATPTLDDVRSRSAASRSG